jgi:hypothetical protein
MPLDHAATSSKIQIFKKIYFIQCFSSDLTTVPKHVTRDTFCSNTDLMYVLFLLDEYIGLGAWSDVMIKKNIFCQKDK